MNLRRIMLKKSELNEKSQSPKAKYCVSPLYKHKHSQNDKVIEKENRFLRLFSGGGD